MNNLFNARRFGRLFKKHSAEHINQYLLSTGVLIGFMTVIMGFVAYLSSTPMVPQMQSVFFILFLLGAGFIFTSSVFSHLGNKSQAIAALSLPASHFEKYLVGWLYSFAFFLIIFTASFYAVTALIVSLDEWHGREKEILNVFSNDQNAYAAYIMYAFLHVVAIWGAIFFTKLQFIKTAFAVLLVSGVITLLNFQVLEALLQLDLNVATPFTNVGFTVDKEYYFLELPEQQKQLVGAVPIIIALFFWVTAYVRIKEKQI